MWCYKLISRMCACVYRSPNGQLWGITIWHISFNITLPYVCTWIYICRVAVFLLFRTNLLRVSVNLSNYTVSSVDSVTLVQQSNHKFITNNIVVLPFTSMLFFFCSPTDTRFTFYLRPVLYFIITCSTVTSV